MGGLGLDGQAPVGSIFMAQAINHNAPTVRDFIQHGPAEWANMIKDRGVPREPNFETNMRHQANRLIDTAAFNINHEIGRMRAGFTPKDPEILSGGNPVIKAFYERALEEARNNPEFGKEGVELMAQGLKDNYSQQIDQLMDVIRNPEKLQPAPERAPTIQAQAPAPGISLV